ncbi:thiamine pyrophosphate-binding protein [Bradyrhizobium sp. JYMT SZCCT0180]|uniref:thiamine pyrophosphate-binding protein n=1 Tax=Bradyrhizobium sp. JYMT SZCCT0180 TaxID=2807666 RepID=UPI001BA7A6FC|nr:thiamine pyrophosphate-binding protein [Bradyrhizobium sp. JYMT SZCCT0180]MBR1212113.1 thiamine pyrophosphate-binding protein [Bradyrhizobium sp. JYMT SZCCT0180]
MDIKAPMRTGGHILIDQLALHGADTVFGVPGESFLAALDGMYQNQRVHFVNSRHEGGAAMMADAYGKLTGKPGIAFATRGPGATNASAGVHVAFQDSTPMILLLGQVGRDMMEREAFQEIDYRQMFGPMTKWVAQIDDARRIPEFISRAFYTATSGRPGPVVLALPEDMLTDEADVPDAQPYKPQTVAPGAESLQQFEELLAAARKPLLIVGGGGWSDKARRDLETFATAHEVPVSASFRCQDYFDNLHAAYAGHVGIGISPKFAERIRDSDLIIALGARLGEITTSGYSLFDIPQPKQPLVHVYPDPEEIGRVYAPKLGIISGSAAFAAAIARLKPKHQPRGDELKAAHADYLAFNEPTRSPGDVQLSRIVRDLSERLPEDAIICNGAGNYAVWVHRFWRYRQFRTELAPTSGSMGYGLPAAVAAKHLHPNRPVIAFAGDGCFQMTGNEFMTAVENRLPLIVIVCNNGMYGTIRMHQERHYPGRVSGTNLANPDFAALARAFGGFGARVDRTEDFAKAFDEAVASRLPAIIELTISPEALTPAASLSETRAKALAAAK